MAFDAEDCGFQMLNDDEFATFVQEESNAVNAETEGDEDNTTKVARVHQMLTHFLRVAAVAKWYRYRIVAYHVTSSSPVPLKTRRVGQRCTLNLSRAETSSRWCGVVVRRGGGASSGVVHVT
ncbi:uncharacterized protein TNCV_4293341 [Trichonephila clavipes]|uniref:Uncharacterized protein n=1 Tax=Trichonephila clavipes TaxID=2585209 RepID=A0A8X6V5W0_TRICX|nr:uncharacterized protein TNCV_4293341 [Trichonephila clavipes]